ncbi:MAG: ATP-binding protein [Nanoarchaeota archaeon]|nr:ATP-binding protein [Nanoarchaeota archaeon]
MAVGRITGKSTTLEFELEVEDNLRKFEYLQLPHPESNENTEVLCQVVEITKSGDKTTAKCNIIGYRKDNRIRQMMVPFDPGTEAERATDDFVSEIIRIEKNRYSAEIGKLQGKNIDVYIDLRKSLSKHISILAKSGSGKSYCTGVLIEEIIEKGIPVIVIDPHGEYNTLKYPGDNKEIAKSYISQIEEYGDIRINPNLKPLKLSNPSSTEEIIHILPAKLNPNQQALVYGALNNLDSFDFESLIIELESEENPSKWTLISMIDHIRKKELFSSSPTNYNELIQPGKCSIINLKGVDPDIQQIIVYKLMNDLFQQRKRERIPPFFAVIEEAHNYCPERSFGEAKSSKILRTIASEGRKFGMGLCIISQRPSRVDKSVLSQCSTQMVLKITNPHDIKAVSNSVEGMTYETEKEIINLPIGEALVTGVVDMPLFVRIRERRTKHGGEQVNLLSEEDTPGEDIIKGIEEFKNKDILPLILPGLSKKDLMLMNDTQIKINTYLVPSVIFTCYTEGEFRILVDLINGKIIKDIDNDISYDLPDLSNLSPNEMETIKMKDDFTAADVMLRKGMDFSSAMNLCETMASKGYLEKIDNKYRTKQGMMIDIIKCNTFKDVEYKNVDYERKLEKKIEIDEIKQKLSKLTEIKDHKECFIVWHKIKSQ